jgi:formaldehyde-activating enzyme
MSDRIVLRTGEALVEAEPAWSAAEPEVVIGDLDGPVGTALATLLGGQVKGHTRVFAILNSDVQVKPATLMVSIDWLLAHQDEVVHYYHQLGLDGAL